MNSGHRASTCGSDRKEETEASISMRNTVNGDGTAKERRGLDHIPALPAFGHLHETAERAFPRLQLSASMKAESGFIRLVTVRTDQMDSILHPIQEQQQIPFSRRLSVTGKLLHLAANIVHAQASVTQMSPDQIELTLLKTFTALQKMQNAEERGIQMDPSTSVEGLQGENQSPGRMNPMDSIGKDAVVCLECGIHMRQLTSKHLSTHGITPREYKKKWGFPLKQALSAKSLTRARSKAAKKKGLPQNLMKFLEDRKTQKGNENNRPAVESSIQTGHGRDKNRQVKQKPDPGITA